MVAHRDGEYFPVAASVVPELKDPRAVEAVDLRQDVPLHGGSENGDVEGDAVLKSLAGKLVVHRSSVGTGGGFVLACGVGLCLHDAERKGRRLGEDRGCNDDDRERNEDSEFHEGFSISDYRGAFQLVDADSKVIIDCRSLAGLSATRKLIEEQGFALWMSISRETGLSVNRPANAPPIKEKSPKTDSSGIVRKAGYSARWTGFVKLADLSGPTQDADRRTARRCSTTAVAEWLILITETVQPVSCAQ